MKVRPRLFIDETTAPVRDPGRTRTKTVFVSAVMRDDRPRGGAVSFGLVFHYAPRGGCEQADRMLAGFEGALQVDG